MNSVHKGTVTGELYDATMAILKKYPMNDEAMISILAANVGVFIAMIPPEHREPYFGIADKWIHESAKHAEKSLPHIFGKKKDRT